MKNQYDLFEKFPDGSSLWKASVIGLEGARYYMRDLAQRSPNRFYALHLVSGKVVYHDRPAVGPLSSALGEKHSAAASA
jgi:hypothetical protein